MAPQPESLLSAKVKDVQDLYERITSTLNLCKGYGKTKTSLLKSKFELATSLRNSLTSVCQEINLLNTQVDSDNTIDVSKYVKSFDQVVEANDVLYREAIDYLNKPATPSPTPAAAVPTMNPNIRLPNITIAHFNNFVVDYPRFARLFEAIYGRNTNLSN